MKSLSRFIALAVLVVGLVAAYAPAADERGAPGGHGEESSADHDSETGHSGSGHGDAEGSPNPLAVDPDLAVWTAIIFVVLLIVLGKFAWRPIAAALDARETSILGHISAAENRHAEARQLLVDYESRLAGAADQVREMLEEARRDAERTKAEILAEAKLAAEAEHERAMRDVRNATDAALKEIGESGANFAVELAGKILDRELTPNDHTRLIRDAMAKLPSNN